MLDNAIKQQLGTHFSQLRHSVTLVLSLDDSDKAQELHALASDIEALSPLITVTHSNNTESRTPQLSVVSDVNDTQIHFAAVPMGHEFTSFVLAILHSGGHPTKASEEDVAQITALDSSLVFETYVSLSCQTCPGVVQALNTLAALNSNIQHTMIDGALFPDEVKERNILSVPAVYLNGKPFAQGAISLAKILTKIDSNAASKQADVLSKKDPFDVLVVGAGPAGSSAAIYAARKGLRVGLVADRFGGQVADTVGIENFISVKATEGPKLVAQLEEHVRDYNVDIMQEQRAASLTAKDGLQLTLENGATLQSKTMILATGARWREMNVPGEQQYKGHGVAYCPHCDGPLFTGKKVAVIGGGNSGIEAALDLANLVSHVTVLEFAAECRADAVLLDKAKNAANIDIITNAQTTEVVGDGERVTSLNYLDRVTNTTHSITLAGIFVQIGLVPNSEWLDENIHTSPRGEIEVSPDGSTSLPGVYAAGDVTNTPYKQIIIAMGSGATASLGAFDYLLRHSD